MLLIINILLFISSFFIANSLVEPEENFRFLGTIMIVAPFVYTVLMFIWSLILRIIIKTTTKVYKDKNFKAWSVLQHGIIDITRRNIERDERENA